LLHVKVSTPGIQVTAFHVWDKYGAALSSWCSLEVC